LDDLTLILLDSNRHELGRSFAVSDFEIGVGSAANDFELRLHSTEADSGGVYVPGTEWGGLIEKTTITSGEDTTLAEGYTWRGLLSKAIIEPPAGQDYMTVSGEANSIIRQVLQGKLGGLFIGSDENSGLNISSYQFDRYCTVLDGLIDMLNEKNFRLDIRAYKPNPGEPVKVMLKAVRPQTISGTFNEDSRLKMTFVKDNMGINHLICLGKGELKDRHVVHLYINQNGQISTTKYYTGVLERVATYDNTSYEDENAFLKEATKRFLEIMSGSNLELSSVTADMEIGDIVTASYGSQVIVTEVSKKVLKTEGGISNVEYSVEEI